MTEIDDVTSSATTKNELAQLVQRYQVCWEVWPEYLTVGHTTRQVGFELELSGSDKGIEFNPTCPECSQIRWALEAIARWILDQKDVERLELGYREQSISFPCARKPSRRHLAIKSSIVPASDPVTYINPIWKNENAASTAGCMRAPMDSQYISSDGNSSRSLDESPELSFDFSPSHRAKQERLCP